MALSTVHLVHMDHSTGHHLPNTEQSVQTRQLTVLSCLPLVGPPESVGEVSGDVGDGDAAHKVTRQ